MRIRTRKFTHCDLQLKWMQKSDRGLVSTLLPTTGPLPKFIDSSQLISANRQGLAVATWRTDLYTDELLLQIFQEVLVDPGLLEAILLSIIILQTGRPVGDTQQEMAARVPEFYGANIAVSTPVV